MTKLLSHLKRSIAALLSAVTLLFGASASAAADLRVTFIEGAPKDRFVIANGSDCPLDLKSVTIELSGSPHGLIFDVTDTGAGVQVFQPFELVAGEKFVRAVSKIRDGDTSVRLDVRTLPAREKIAFTIDIDDTVRNQETIVSDSEIAGARVNVQIGGNNADAAFTADAVAVIPTSACTS